MRAHVCAVAALAAMLAAPAARAGDVRDPDTFLGRLRREVRQALERASQARPPRPPTPVPVTWKPLKLTPLDLGAPLVALTAGDLDGDGRAELAAVTERDVVVLAARRRGFAEVARTPLPVDAPAIRPRDAVGAAVIVPGPRAELWARASTSGRGARYVLDKAVLREVGPVSGFPVCAGRSLELVPGRNTYGGGGGGALHGLRCRDDLVDPQGRALRVEATLASDGMLGVVVSSERVAPRRIAVGGVGTAFEIADVDNDGRPELIHAGAGAPGDADAIAVHSLPASGVVLDKPVFRRGFSGGVAGVVAADVDGDGDIEVIAAVRLPGAQKVDLWLLD